MAKIRTIKPDLFRHDGLFEAEQQSGLPLRLAFMGLFTCCDRAGRFRWKPRALKLDILPYDDVNFGLVLQALHQAGFIHCYEEDNERYGYIPSWIKHQTINSREPESKLPVPTDNNRVQSIVVLTNNPIANGPPKSDVCFSASDAYALPMHAHARLAQSSVQACDEHSATCCDAQVNQWNSDATVSEMTNNKKEVKVEKEIKQSSLIKSMPTDLTEGVLLEPSLTNINQATTAITTILPTQHAAQRDIAIEQVFGYWKTCLQHSQAKLDNKRKRLISQALKAGYSVEQLCQAIMGCSLTPHNIGDNERGQRYDGLHVILRDADQIDRFIANAKHPPQSLNAAERQTKANIQTLQRWLNQKQMKEVN